MQASRLLPLCLSLALAAWVPAHAAPSLESYALTAGGTSVAPPGAPPFACATFGPDPRAAAFLGNFQVGLPTGSDCGVGIDSRLATAASGPVQVAATLAVGFGQPGDLRSFVGTAAGRAGYGDLGASAAASYSGNSGAFTVSGSQAFGLQIETMTFGGAAGAGIFRPIFTVDGSLFNVGRTDSELAFGYSAGNGPSLLALRIRNSRGTLSFYTPGGYVASLPGMTVTGDLVNGLNVAGSTTFSIDIPMVFGTAFDVTYGLWAASLPSSSAGQLTASAGDVSFISSARMTGIDVYTAAGQAVTAFTVSAGSGTLYGAGGVLPQVPEPGTWLMMGLGLMVLAARRVARPARPARAPAMIAKRWNNCAAPSPARLAGRAGPEARPLARHKQSTELFVSGLGAGQRARADERRRTGGAQAQDPLARRHHASGDVAAGVHAASGGIGATAVAASDPRWCPRNFASRSERTPASRTTAFLHPTPSCVRWWCRKSASRPPRPRHLPSARRSARTTGRCG